MLSQKVSRLVSSLNIVCDGNSITIAEGYGGLPWPTVLKQLPDFSDPSCVLTNLAVGGQTTGDMLADASTQVDTLFNPAKYNVLIAMEMLNDIRNTGNEEACFQRFYKYLRDRKARGWYVIGCTTMASTDLNPVNAANLQTKIAYVNGRLRSVVPNCCDCLIDTIAIPTLSNASDLSMFPDLTHPTQLAQVGMVEAIAAVLRRL
jgi:hypothetical protein